MLNYLISESMFYQFLTGNFYLREEGMGNTPNTPHPNPPLTRLFITHIFLNNLETFMWQWFQRLKISLLLTKCTLLFLIKPLFY
jgi:hypothetical protein